jgi:hypothetical protein
MHAGTQHIIPSAPILQRLGRQLAGLEEGKVWQFLELVER